jgi:hypothetical protein
MIPVDYDFISPAVKAGWEIPFTNLPDWTRLNLFAGGYAASSFTRAMFGGRYWDVNDKKAAYAEMRFCMTGPNGSARLAAFTTQGLPPTQAGECTPVGNGPENLGADVTLWLNNLMSLTKYWQFMPECKGTGILYLARLQVDWRVTHVVTPTS